MQRSIRIAPMAAIVLAVLVGCAPLARAQQERSVRVVETGPDTVQVSGTAVVRLEPDRARFEAGVETVAATVGAAVEQNNEGVQQILDALRAAGVPKEDIRTARLHIFPQWDYQEGKRPRITGYRVTNTVVVQRPASPEVGRLLQTVVEAGANQVSELSFVVSDPAAGERDGLQRAFENAKTKAEILARAAGRTLGEALAIAEGRMPEPPRPVIMERMAAQEADQSMIPVEPGTEERRFTVGVTFALR